MHQQIRERLLALSEPDFQRFTSRLLPGVGNILGVRLPALRRLAKEIARGDWRAYLDTAGTSSFEEIMLQGMVIGAASAPVEELLSSIAAFLPKIDNWSVCDSFCSGLKMARTYPEEVWSFLKPYLESPKEFEARFGAVMLLNYFVDEAHIGQVLPLLGAVPAQGYYARMAVAWALSICYLHFPEKTLAFLRQGDLDNFTYNKALQKIVESQCTDAATKAVMRAMKRPEAPRTELPAMR
ncbi:DNA alkylation repair protein [Zongyangia hominis]|uniref:DNA alkylation repair protein n=1 Tax=Zongyangia hominis TaxID=2763677 RepID=A0A926E8T6_9FIRM|nr:DNA alkylation repair protein [Zongyangia hominis]MBC8569323.1 DNA alkylation repair protein [Zongyangia hominis]